MSKKMFLFEIIFHSLLLLLASFVVTAYVLSEEQAFYIIIGVLIAVNSLIRIIRAVNKRSKNNHYQPN
ncbi:hypothetical protein [Halobacillus salinus]|uniref:hypothetical protein n=1 Tax=Halobacillus salinus TaxID=192814 RepID=UPI0009A8E269|nr:hypothetical protein [Halobacillus salinus]